MAAKLTIKLTPLNLAIGVAFVVVAIALFSWLLPMFLPPERIYNIAGAMIGVIFWFLFMRFRQEGN